MLRDEDRKALISAARSDRRTIERFLHDGTTPHLRTLVRLRGLGVRTARAKLKAWGMEMPADDLDILAAYAAAGSGQRQRRLRVR